MANWGELMPYLSKSFSAMGAGSGPDGGIGSRLGAAGMEMADSSIMSLMAEKQRKKAEEKEKGSKLGKIGSTLGSIAGYALAPVTGGASLALSTGLGAGLGSVAGQAMGGQGIDWGDAMRSGVTSGIGTAVAPGVMDKLGMPNLPSAAEAAAHNRGWPGGGLAAGVGNAVQNQLFSRGFGAMLGGAMVPDLSKLSPEARQMLLMQGMYP